MSLDPTASEFFFRSSIKKYFIDTLTTASGKLVVFDKTILHDEVVNYSVDEWIVINFGIFHRDLISRNVLDINCCTRNDPEGVKLSKLTDLVAGYLSDSTKTDTMRRIPLFDATAVDPADWVSVGAMLVTTVMEGQQNTTSDQTKVKTMTPILSWGTII